MLLIGDPSTAKSQFLKFAAQMVSCTFRPNIHSTVDSIAARMPCYVRDLTAKIAICIVLLSLDAQYSSHCLIWRWLPSAGWLTLLGGMPAGSSRIVHSRENIQWARPHRQHAEEAQRAVLPRGDKQCLHDSLLCDHTSRMHFHQISVTSQPKRSLVTCGSLLLQYQQLGVTRHAAIASPSSITWQLSGFWVQYVCCAQSCSTVFPCCMSCTYDCTIIPDVHLHADRQEPW